VTVTGSSLLDMTMIVNKRRLHGSSGEVAFCISTTTVFVPEHQMEMQSQA
jgi:hypothetical protein